MNIFGGIINVEELCFEGFCGKDVNVLRVCYMGK